ncbi:MAG: acyl carrier protein [Planctomycetota bacterium]
MAVTADSLITYLRETVPFDLGEVDEETPLFSSRMIDSYAMVGLMRFIETEACFRVAAFEVSLENFDTVGRILRYVESRVLADVKK